MTPAERNRAHSLALHQVSVGDIVSLPRIGKPSRSGWRYRVVEVKAVDRFVGGWEIKLQPLPEFRAPWRSAHGYALGHIKIEQPNGAEPAHIDADATAIPKTEPTPEPPTGSRKVDARTRERNVVEDIAAWLELAAIVRMGEGRESAARDISQLANDIRRGEWRKADAK